jgi:hypothetical protein
VQRSTFLRCDAGGPAPAGLTFHLRQFTHVTATLDPVEAP